MNQLFADKGADLTPMVSTTMAHPTYAAVTDHEIEAYGVTCHLLRRFATTKQLLT